MKRARSHSHRLARICLARVTLIYQIEYIADLFYCARERFPESNTPGQVLVIPNYAGLKQFDKVRGSFRPQSHFQIALFILCGDNC
jgi:hypothetical protein